MKHRLPLLILVLALLAVPAQAQKKKSSQYEKRITGLSVTVDAGLLVPNAKQADFYSGRPGNDNTIMRVLRSQQYGTQIWNELVSAQLISPSAIPSYEAFDIAEYGRMYYKLTYQLGVGIRYDYESGWGWLLHFDYSQVAAAGQFQLSSNNGTGILGPHQYVTCDVYGIEKRMLIDFAIAKRIPLSRNLDLELDFGFDLNNTKVQENGIRVNGHTYSILDIWGGRTPDMGSVGYEYINQGGIGIGGLAAVALSYVFDGATVDFGYNLYYIQTKYKGYNDENAYAFQHNIFLRFNLNNFSFFGK